MFMIYVGSLKFLVHKEEEIAQKFLENVGVDKKKGA